MFHILLLLLITDCTKACYRKTFDQGSVCVCNSTHCDDTPKLGFFDKNSIKIYYTSNDEPGFNAKKTLFASKKNTSAQEIKLTQNYYQSIIGFGGSFTDATCVNIKKLPRKAQQFLLQSYFGENGIGYNLCRVPIGGSDFSIRPYSYDDHDGDRTLEQFELQKEDILYKVSFHLFN